MKYVKQLGIICGICCVAEVLYRLIPLPIPDSIYGLVLLFILLLTKIIKLEQIEGVAQFLLTIMPILFISPSVSLMESSSTVKGQLIPIILMVVLSTVLVIGATGVVSQFVVRSKHKKIFPIKQQRGSKDE